MSMGAGLPLAAATKAALRQVGHKATTCSRRTNDNDSDPSNECRRPFFPCDDMANRPFTSGPFHPFWAAAQRPVRWMIRPLASQRSVQALLEVMRCEENGTQDTG